MGRFSHLLQREVFEDLHGNPHTQPTPNVNRPWNVHGAGDAWLVHAVGSTKAGVMASHPEESVLRPGPATEMLFERAMAPLADLQILDEDESDDALPSTHGQQEDKDLIHRIARLVAALSETAAASAVEAAVILPGANPALSAVPFELGLGQIQSAYAVERIEHACGEDEDDTTDCSSDDEVSITCSSAAAPEWTALGDPHGQAKGETETRAAAAESLPGPHMVAKLFNPNGTAHPSLDLANFESANVPGGSQLTPGRQIDEQLDQELAYIKEAITKSEQLLQGQKQAHCAGETLRSGVTTYRVGLLLWPAKNDELVITGFEKGSSAASSGLILGDVVIEVDGESIKGLPPCAVTQKMAGMPGTKVDLTVSRIISHVKSVYSLSLIRDVSPDVDDLVVSTASSGPLSHQELVSREDPILVAIHAKNSPSPRAQPETSTLTTADSKNTRADQRLSLPDRHLLAKAQHTGFLPQQELEAPAQITPQLGPVHMQEQIDSTLNVEQNEDAAGLSSPTLDKRSKPIAAHRQSPAAPPLLTPPQQPHFKSRRALGQIQDLVKSAPAKGLRVCAPTGKFTGEWMRWNVDENQAPISAHNPAEQDLASLKFGRVELVPNVETSGALECIPEDWSRDLIYGPDQLSYDKNLLSDLEIRQDHVQLIGPGYAEPAHDLATQNQLNDPDRRIASFAAESSDSMVWSNERSIGVHLGRYPSRSSMSIGFHGHGSITDVQPIPRRRHLGNVPPVDAEVSELLQSTIAELEVGC